jgi:hypothetical protein
MCFQPSAQNAAASAESKTFGMPILSMYTNSGAGDVWESMVSYKLADVLGNVRMFQASNPSHATK